MVLGFFFQLVLPLLLFLYKSAMCQLSIMPLSMEIFRTGFYLYVSEGGKYANMIVNQTDIMVNNTVYLQLHLFYQFLLLHLQECNYTS